MVARNTTRKNTTEKKRRMGPRIDNTRRVGSGVIRPDEVYTLEEAAVRLEQGARTVRGALTEGLKSMFFGKRKYILGQDLIDFLKKREVVPGQPPQKKR